MTRLLTVSKSEVMKNAAVRYNRYNSFRVAGNERFANLSTNELKSKAVKYAWAELKSDISELNAEIIAKNEEERKSENQKKSSNKSANGRYVELLSVAVKSELNHGASWYASGNDIDKNQLHPSWEGEEICYVYAA